MNKIIGTILIAVIAVSGGCSQKAEIHKGFPSDLISPKEEKLLDDTLEYHKVRVDENGAILPWFSKHTGQSYDHVLSRVWYFWKNIKTDSNGHKYYLHHQVWRPDHDRRGLGGDQLNMALSSWDLYYNFTGDSSLIGNMRYMADYYLANSLSSPDDAWPNLPYPYNMNVESGIYDGDMILGKNYLQPDKAGSFGYELIHLYKKTDDRKYLDAAANIATTLAAKVQPGDADNSPWPFKVNAKTGETGLLIENEMWYEGMDKDIGGKNKVVKKSSYTTFWTGTLGLFTELIALKHPDAANYQKAFDMALAWMKKYPVKNNRWGPFFEDIPRWSDTQINAVTYAMYLMDNTHLDENWKASVTSIFKWVYDSLTDNRYSKYKVKVIDEQTAYRQPGNSHSSRQASVELRYWELTGDTTYVRNAVRMLNWATYMVDHDGKNFYPTNDVWLTDGYGDYTRHYLRALAACPQLAPERNCMLRSSSVIKSINYTPAAVTYKLFDNKSKDVVRLMWKPASVSVSGSILAEVQDSADEGWTWETLEKGGVVRINNAAGSNVTLNQK